MTALTLTIPGPPRTKKTHNRVVFVKGKPKVLPSEQWIAWRDDVHRWWLQTFTASRRQAIASDVTVNCCALFYRDARRGDASGYYQGLADVLQFLEIVPNDAQIVQWDGSRLLTDPANPRVEVTLTLTAA